MKKLVALIFLALAPTFTLLAQDPIFTQAYSSGMYLNPALTGELKGFVTNAQYRNQWPNISGNYVTSLFGIQKRFDSLGLGVGVNLIHDEAGQATLATTGIGLVVSKWFKTGKKSAISLGFNASYYEKTIDVSKLTFGNMIDPKTGFTNDTNSTSLNTSVSYLTLSAGLLVKYANGNSGITISNFNTPNESFVSGGHSNLPIKLTIHNTNVYSINKALNWKFSHTIIYNRQQDFQSLIGYITTQFKWFKVCTGYSTMNSIIAGGGIALPRFNINYIYETTISKLTKATGGAHEIGMSFRFGNKKEYGDAGSLSF